MQYSATGVSKFIERTEINPEDAKIAVKGLRIIETYRDYKDIDAKKELERLCGLVKKHQIIRRQYLWEGADYYRNTEHREPLWLGQILCILNLVSFDKSDIGWLAKCVRKMERIEDKFLSALCLRSLESL